MVILSYCKLIFSLDICEQRPPRGCDATSATTCEQKQRVSGDKRLKDEVSLKLSYCKHLVFGLVAGRKEQGCQIWLVRGSSLAALVPARVRAINA